MRSTQMLELLHIMIMFIGVICSISCLHSGSQSSSCGQHQGFVYVVSYLPVHQAQCSICVGFSQPPMIASVQSVVHGNCKHSVLGIHVFQHTSQYSKLQYRLRSLIYELTIEVISLEPSQGAPQIASSLTVCNFLHHVSCYCIAISLIFPAFTLSLTFSNSRSLLQLMELTYNPVCNYYSQMNQEAHLQRSCGSKEEVNLHCPSIVCLQIICLWALYFG